MNEVHEQQGSVEQEARTVDEAVERALERLGVSRDVVEIEVLDAGSKGLFSFLGAKNARVRVTVKESAWEQRVADVVRGLMDRMGISTQIQVERQSDGISVRIDSAGSDGLLIGRRGETLAAIQHLVGRMVNRGAGRRLPVLVDVGGYRKRREAQLQNLARSLAAKVEASGGQLLTEPLSAAERRIIHITLADNPAVRTETIGDGLMKKVAVIRVKDSAGVSRQNTD